MSGLITTGANQSVVTAMAPEGCIAETAAEQALQGPLAPHAAEEVLSKVITLKHIPVHTAWMLSEKRHAQIALGDLDISSSTKYSAIYTRDDTCIEYRLFDARFVVPSYIISYFELISRTLPFPE